MPVPERPHGVFSHPAFAAISRVLLLGVAFMTLAGAAVPAASAAATKPLLKVSGTTLTWNAQSGVSSYQPGDDQNPKTTRDTTYQTVTGTSFAPPAVPGQAVNYGLRANVSGAPWAAEVTINWPVPLPPAPSLKASGTTLTWNALSGVSSYLLATIKNPTTTRDTTYQTVTGTSFTPPAVPGQAVGYGLSANVSGAPWAPEVTINWPAPLPPKPVLTLSGTTLNWTALSGVSSYVVATIKNPTTTRDTTYQTVTGTSFTPPAVPGSDGQLWTVGECLRCPVGLRSDDQLAGEHDDHHDDDRRRPRRAARRRHRRPRRRVG